jgi:hypothetical protein
MLRTLATVSSLHARQLRPCERKASLSSYILRGILILNSQFINYKSKIKNSTIMITQTYPAPETSKKSVWSVILKVIIAVATTIAGAFGLQACQML